MGCDVLLPIRSKGKEAGAFLLPANGKLFAPYFVKDEIARMIGLKRGRQGPKGDEIQDIPLDLIDASPYQPREQFDEAGLQELAQSIKQHGVIQAIVVRRIRDRYEVIVGERRLRACRLLGLKTIPAIVKEMDDVQAAEISLIENLQRKDLTVIEEARGYQKLIKEFGFTQQEVAQKVGKDQSTIANKLRLLRLPDKVLEYIAREMITERHARSLLRLPDPDTQMRMAEEICSSGLTVSQTDQAVDVLLQRLATKEPEKPVVAQRRLVRAFKDIRLFTNSIRQIVKELRRAGIPARLEEREIDGWLEFIIRINRSEADTGGQSENPGGRGSVRGIR